MIELPDNENHRFTNIQKVLTTQISRQKWNNFFRIIAGFRFQNFDILQWIRGDMNGKFELDKRQVPRERPYRERKAYWTLNEGKSSTHYIAVIEDVIRRHDVEERLQFGWYMIIKRLMEFPPAIREVYFKGTAQIFRKLDIELIQKKKKERNPHTQIVPTGYKISQEVEDWVQSGKGVTLPAITTPAERAQLPRIYNMMWSDLLVDYYNYCGWDKFKKDSNDKGKKYELLRENDEEYLETIRNYLEKDEEENFEKLKQLQVEHVQRRNQEEKMQKFIDLSWKSWIENQKEENQCQSLESQGSQLRDLLENQNFQTMKKYVYQRIQPHRDKRLLQIDKLKHKYWILLIRAYLSELSPNHKQRRFVSWCWKRKGRQRWKQREKGTRESFGRDNESDYSNHEEEENSVIYNGRIYSGKQQTQGSSLLFRATLENSEIYKNSKFT
jgi:hypothetical protein